MDESNEGLLFQPDNISNMKSFFEGEGYSY